MHGTTSTAPATQLHLAAAQRIENLPNEYAYFDRRNALRNDLEAWGLTPVATVELHLLEEECEAIQAMWDGQQQSEIDAENALLVDAEYDPRMFDPREW